MRVGIIGLLQESNTFIGQPTTIERFEQDLLLTGEAIRKRMTAAHHEVGGFFAGLEEADIEAVPIFLARALPYGAMTEETYQSLRQSMLTELRAAGSLDGIVAACHGANVAAQTRDVDGEWLCSIRAQLGPERPLIGTLDPHGNLSQQMVEATDALIAYRTNPHIDQRQCGLSAARLMARTLRGEVRPVQAATFPPLAINIECQETSKSPCAPHYAKADEQLSRPNVLSNSLMLGFPYADVREMGSATIVVTDNDLPLAESLANQLAEGLWNDRASFVPKLLSPDEAVLRAMDLDGPVGLLDMGDNVGGGSPGDGTTLLHAIRKHRAGNALACIYDPEAVAIAEDAGIGGSIEVSIGAKTDRLHGEPFQVNGQVRGIYDGRFQESQPRHGGFTNFDQGRTAVVEGEDRITLLLNSRRMVPFSLEQLRSCQLDPAAYQLLVIKGVHAPIAAYEEVCRHFLRVNTPGVTTADMTLLEYRHRRKPLYPLEQDCQWHP